VDPWIPSVSLWYDLVSGCFHWVEERQGVWCFVAKPISTLFVVESEPRLRQALSATLGTQAGRDATADAIGYAWENWERIQPVG